MNAFYEDSDTFRDFGHLERYGINPTVTLKPDDDTKIKLSYEYFHDDRTADRGNPSQGLPGGVDRDSIRPTPFAPNGRPYRPSSAARASTSRRPTCRPAWRFIEHDFGTD